MEFIPEIGDPELNIYIHLETGILLLFLAMMVWTQAERASVPGYYSRKPRQQMIGLSIVFAALSVGLGSLLYSVSPLLGIALAAGFTLSLIHPVNALCFFVHLLFLRPWEILTTSPVLLALPRLLAAVSVISWLLYPGKCGKPTVRTTHALMLFLGFSLWLFLTTFRAPDIAVAQMDWFNTFFKSVIVFLMCLFFIESEMSVREFELTLVLSALGLMGIGLFQFLTTPTLSGRLDAFGAFGDPNDLASIIIMALPLALVPVFNKRPGLARRICGVAFAGFSVLVIWFTNSRGAILSLLVQVLAFLGVRSSRRSWLPMAFLGGLVGLGFLVVYKAIPRAPQEMEASQESRITYWKAAVNMTLHHPIWGVGFDQYPDNYVTYASGVKYEWGKRTAHSSWLLAFAESGLIGGLLYVAFVLTVMRTAWRNRETWPAQFFALAGYGVAMTFLSHTYGIYIPVLAGLILASNSIKERAAILAQPHAI